MLTQALKLEVNLGDDNVADSFSYVHGGGKELVKIYNFDTTSDDLSANVAVGAAATAIGATTAALMIGGALGATISSSDVSTAGASNNITAMYTYNGDTFFLSQADGNELDGTFGSAEVIFQFVGVTDIVAADIGDFS